MFKNSQGWIKISTRAVQCPCAATSCPGELRGPSTICTSKLSFSFTSPFMLTSPQEPKWRSEIAGPGDDALATSMGLDAGAKCGRGQEKKKEKPKNPVQNQPQEGRRAPSVLCILAGNTSDILCVHLTPVST